VTKRAAGVLLAVLLLAVLPAVGGAQASGGGRPCELEFEKLRDSTTTLLQRQLSGKYNAFQGGGVRYRCKGQNVTMDADSAAYYGDLAILYLIGQVHYQDDDATLDADRITYYQNEEWVVAGGNVSGRMANGSTMQGPEAEYYRVIPDVRPVERLIASQRPSFRLQQPDSAGQQRPPVDVVANRVVAEGDSLIFASGQVEIERPDLRATSDSAMLDQGTEFGRLIRNARVVGSGERSYTLTGRMVDLFSRERQLMRVLATGEAEAVSEDVTVTSDTLDLRLADGQIERAFAWGGGEERARATSPGREMTADSLEVQMVGKTLSQLFAVGSARLESIADTLKIRSDERDWLVGDTVIAHFDTAATAEQGDSTSQPVIREVLARGNARSYQQIPPDSGVTERPSIHYVIGRDIAVTFDSGEVRTVTVVAPDSGQTVGVYLDATGQSSGAAARNPREQPDRSAPPPRPTSPPSAPPPDLEDEMDGSSPAQSIVDSGVRHGRRFLRMSLTAREWIP